MNEAQREMNLKELVETLPSSHKARREYEKLIEASKQTCPVCKGNRYDPYDDGYYCYRCNGEGKLEVEL